MEHMPSLLWLVFFAGGTVAAGQAHVESISSDVLPLSGRLLLFGSGWNDEQRENEVRIDGIEAIVTQWLPGEIHAYVPESCSLGQVTVQVFVDEVGSNIVELEVVPRLADGRIDWVFELDRWMTRQFIAVADDGSIYTADQLGLYKLSNDGGLIWFHAGAGGVFPISLADDGTIYAGRILEAGTLLIRAINPDGSTKWEFHDPVDGYALKLGPSVGPDGNIYAATGRDISPLGAFSLDADGNLRWSSEGMPEFISTRVPELTASNVALDGTNAYLGWMHTTATPEAYALQADNGEQQWFSGNSDLDIYFFSFPKLDPDGRLVGVWGQTGVIVITPQGETEWFAVHPSQINVNELPDTDAKGNIYIGASRSELWSLTPDGETRWVLPTQFNTSLSKIGLAPDDSIIVAHHFRSGQPTSITGHNPADGSFQFLVELPDQDGSNQQVTSIEPGFSADSSTAYVTASAGSTALDASRLYAIDITLDGADLPGDIDGDQDVDIFDFELLVESLAGPDVLTAPPGVEPEQFIASDLDGDQDVDLHDCAMLVATFSG